MTAAPNVLPPGVSEDAFSAAIARFREIVGDKYVLTEDGPVRVRYARSSQQRRVLVQPVVDLLERHASEVALCCAGEKFRTAVNMY